ncbi:hypothetical protein FDG2_0125 [Candidatus Protofrankia californiensis]|uniref:Uncharacterized protein n=1 Tax=Candidatus Protofrankia californiensis TaxID=1839754 RepID=A0A1C3NSW0_9ACTN|nr:hypothetical protein FDG2_0125 [Candidatus Protofrankia californiensis]
MARDPDPLLDSAAVNDEADSTADRAARPRDRMRQRIGDALVNDPDGMAARSVPDDYAADVLDEHGQADDAPADDTRRCRFCGEPVRGPGADIGNGPEHPECVPDFGGPADGDEHAVLYDAAVQLGQLQAYVRMLELALDAGNHAEIARLIRAAVEVTR